MRDRAKSVAIGEAPRIWVQKNYASFNGIRGLAVTITFFAHFIWIMPVGRIRYFERLFSVGVDLFFVLSGFLITGILYDSLQTQRYFKNFYIRRALRIFPLFYGIYVVLFLLAIPLHMKTDPLMPSFLLYFGNLIQPFKTVDGQQWNYFYILHHGRNVILVSLGHIWSLCVEEQFYLCWPAVVWFVRDREKLMKLCVAGVVFALILRYTLEYLWPNFIDNTNFVYVCTFTRFDTLLVGAWAALYLRGKELTRTQLHRASTLLAVVPTIALIVGFSFRLHIGGFHIVRMLSYTLVALAGLGVVLRSLDDTSRLSRILRFRPLARLGIVSYGFYIIHGMFGVITHEVYEAHRSVLMPQRLLRLLFVLAYFAFVWGVSELSFRFYEERFLRLKSKLAPQRNKIHIDAEAASAS